MTSKDWSNAEVRFFFLNNDNSLQYSIKKAIEKRTEELRSQVVIEVINNEIEQKDFYEVVKTNSFESDLILIDLPELDQDNEEQFVEKTNDLLGVLGTTLIVKASSHFNDGLGINSTIEKGFNTISDNSLAVRIEEELPQLGQIGFSEIHQIIETFDESILGFNQQFVNTVYSPLNKVYEVFATVLSQDKLTPNEVYSQVEELLVDIQENRLNSVGEGIAVGIKAQLSNLKKTIDVLPFQITRYYDSNELLIKESDSSTLKKQKKKLTRWTSNPKTKVKIQSIAQHHY
jgi:hypothetical protein